MNECVPQSCGLSENVSVATRNAAGETVGPGPGGPNY